MKYILLLLVFILLLSFGAWFVLPKKSPSSYIPKTSPTKSASSSPISVGETPDIPLKLPAGFTIHIFAKGLGKPRDLAFSPGGTLLVSNPDSGSIAALPDIDNNGVANSVKTVIDGLSHPHGIAFYNGKLFVATTTQVVRYSWDESTLSATKEKLLFTLPENNDHNNRTITFDTAGTMYVSVGSTCNVCFEADERSGSIMISNSNGDNTHIFAQGLRNAAFMQISPLTKQLWVSEMGRDNIGDITPPDEIDIVDEGENYGWPLCFGQKIHDTNFDKKPRNTDPCIDTIAPIYEIPAHSAPLGLVFINSKQFPGDWQNDLLVAYHGSWNRSTPIGYKLVHLKVSGNSITDSQDFLTGFIPETATSGNQAQGRPVDVIFDKNGSLYVSDDKAGAIYIIQKNS